MWFVPIYKGSLSCSDKNKKHGDPIILMDCSIFFVFNEIEDSVTMDSTSDDLHCTRKFNWVMKLFPKLINLFVVIVFETWRDWIQILNPGNPGPWNNFLLSQIVFKTMNELPIGADSPWFCSSLTQRHRVLTFSPGNSRRSLRPVDCSRITSAAAALQRKAKLHWWLVY